MPALPVDVLRQACRVFFDLAYPDGPSTVPAGKLPYSQIPEDARVEDYLPPAPVATGIVNLLTGAHEGYSIRLGSAAFPFLRLTLQHVADESGDRWVAGVDTHDAWRHPDHADAAAWLALQAANRELKSRIEHAFEAAGLCTHNRLLRQQLEFNLSHP